MNQNNSICSRSTILYSLDPHIKLMQKTFQQVKGLVDNEKRVIYNSIQNIMGTSCLTIFKIIHLGSSHWGKNKTRVHRLYQNSKKNWKVNSFKLYKNHLTRDHTEYHVAVDKLLAYVNDANKKRGICYLEADNVPECWVFKISKSFPEGFIMDGITSSQGALFLIKVANIVKINRL